MAKTIALLFAAISFLTAPTYAFHESPEVLAAKPGVAKEAKAILEDLEVGKVHPNIGGCKAAVAKNMRGEIFLNLIDAAADTEKKRLKLGLMKAKHSGIKALADFAAANQKKRDVLADAYVPQAEWEVNMAKDAYQAASLREDALELLTHDFGHAEIEGGDKDIEFIGPCRELSKRAH